MRVIIGLTGNIATGKSTVMALAAARGALTIDADAVVHELLVGDEGVKSAVRGAFGDTVFGEDGEIIRPNLAKIVFTTPPALKQLESILHPAVRHAIRKQIMATRATIIMIEAIKLLEGELKAECNQIWVTVCSPATQAQRLQENRGLDSADSQRRISAQSDPALKVAQADVVIHTDGTMGETVAQFETAWQGLVNKYL